MVMFEQYRIAKKYYETNRFSKEQRGITKITLRFEQNK